MKLLLSKFSTKSVGNPCLFCFKYFFLLLVIFGLGLGEAQAQAKQDLEAYIQAGNELFAQENYLEAKKYYALGAKFYPADGGSAYQLAQCHEKLFEYEKAEEWYGKAYQRDSSRYLMALLHKSEMQKANNNLDSAQKSLDSFIRLYEPASREDSLLVRRAIIESESLELIGQENQKPKDAFGFAVLSAPINSKYAEYAACFLKSDSFMVVSSHRPSSKLNKKTDNRSGFYFSDNYVFERKKQRWVERPGFQNFDITNTPVNDGAGCFALNNSRYYFTSCSQAEGKCQIYVSQMQNGRWQAPIALNNNINLAGSETKHPSVSVTGDTLYFVSNRPGGLGQNDIWYSVRQNKTEEWGEATNTGPAINTAFDEISPFFDAKDKVLFFSSTGYKGLGGLDIYMSRLNEAGTFGAVSNLGVPFNSNRDDFFFVVFNKAGMITSNREGRVQNYDIYSFQADSRMELLASLEANSVKNIIASNKPVRRRQAEEEQQLEAEKEKLYSQMSAEEKDKIRRIMAWRKAKAGYADTDTSGEGERADSMAFAKLGIEEQNKVGRIAAMLPAKDYYLLDPQLKQADERFYASLDGMEKDRLDRFIFRNMAGNIRNQDLPLQQYDKQFWATLSAEDRLMIDRLAALRLSKYYYGADPGLMAQDEKFYKGLPAEVRNRIERMIGLRENKNVYRIAPTLKIQDENFMQNLSSIERDRINRLIALKHKQKIYPDPELEKKEQLWPHSLPMDQSLSVQRLIDARATSWLYGQDKKLLKADKAWYALLSPDEKIRIDRLSARRLSKLSGADNAKLKASDQQWLNQLSVLEKEQIGRIIANRNNRYVNGLDVGLSAEDRYAWQNMSPELKDFVNRQARSAKSKNLSQINDEPVADQKDSYELRPLASDDHSEVGRLIEAKAKSRRFDDNSSLKAGEETFYQSLSSEDKKQIANRVRNRLINQMIAQDLNLEKSGFDYANLSAENKAKVDRLIANRLGTNMYGKDVELKDADEMYFKGLLPPHRNALNRLIAAKKAGYASPVEELDLSGDDKMAYNQLNLMERQRIDRLTRSLLGENAYSRDMALKEADDLYYSQLSADEKEWINRLMAARKKSKTKYAEDPVAGVQEQDKTFYYNLNAKDKQRIDRLAATSLGKDVYTQNPALRKEDQTYMSSLKPDEQLSMNSVISMRNVGKFMLSDEALSRNTYFGRPALYGRIYFDKNSSSVRVDAYKFLDNVAAFLKSNPGKKLYIYAHADSYGDKVYNQELSEKRARYVRNYITKKGLKVEVIVPQGEGDAFPVAPNTTAAGRQLNRRAELFIVD